MPIEMLGMPSEAATQPIPVARDLMFAPGRKLPLGRERQEWMESGR